MSISTYSELQTAVQNWLDDASGNQVPAARAQEFIALAEADMNRRLRVREMLTVATGTLVAGTATVALPAGFAGAQSLTVTDSGYESPLAQMAPDAAMEAYHSYGSGVPAHFTIEGSNLRLYPTPDSAYAYTLRYWAKLAALSDSATSNWLLASHPDAYLFGALTHAEGYRVNDIRLAGWRAQYDMALEQVRQQSMFDSAAGRSFAYIQGGTP